VYKLVQYCLCSIVVFFQCCNKKWHVEPQHSFVLLVGRTSDWIVNFWPQVVVTRIGPYTSVLDLGWQPNCRNPLIKKSPNLSRSSSPPQPFSHFLLRHGRSTAGNTFPSTTTTHGGGIPTLFHGRGGILIGKNDRH